MDHYIFLTTRSNGPKLFGNFILQGLAVNHLVDCSKLIVVVDHEQLTYGIRKRTRKTKNQKFPKI